MFPEARWSKKLSQKLKPYDLQKAIIKPYDLQKAIISYTETLAELAEAVLNKQNGKVTSLKSEETRNIGRSSNEGSR